VPVAGVAGTPVAVRGEARCPKCGQRLDDGADPYLCCADAVLTWRCTRCAKVSEGFALPHGACPACGGALERTDPAPVAGDDAGEAVRTAVQIELGGRAFYRAAAAGTDRQELAELFGRFASMEDDHLATLGRRYHVRLDGEGGTAAEGGRSPVTTAARPSDPEELFAEAIAFEERAVAFFAARAADAPGPAQSLYEELAAEEREHVDLLRTERERWRRAAPGLL
jgi:rubrerythrin/DNA-directed RNA polymerase subunit RPC12/RpoP